MILKKIKYTIEELKALGFRDAVYRIYYEASLRTNIRIDKIDVNELKFNISLNEWRRNRVKCFFPNKEEILYFYKSVLTPKDIENIIDIANHTLKGRILCFSKWYADYGYPINWHYNPKTCKTWPLVPWTKVMKYERECGDIKLTWEVNRFSHLYYLVRAYILTGDKIYVRSFLEQLRSWEENNPYEIGINWNSSQELTIRVLAWIYALYMMGDDSEFKEEDFERLMRLIYLHARHIERNIDYAYYAVYNNHLIGEALGLYAIGTLFPFFKESKRWKEKGKKILEGDRCLRQFYRDGGYIQLSFNYHRLALHYYLWALRIGEVNEDRFDNKIYQILEKSSKFLYSFINLDDGKLPNWGANDGALLNPWTVCDYRDYRPLLNSLSYITRKVKLFPLGPWDEELLWFFGQKAIDSEVKPYELISLKFPTTGIHVLRKNKNSFLVFRCGSVNDRFGQADQLHVDVWWKGINIAIDGGSYLYNDELEYHKYFVGTTSHNTVTVDDEDQMLLYRRFKWLYWTKAKLIDFDEDYAEGEHYGYSKKGIIHRRKIKFLSEDCYLIRDFLLNKNKMEVLYDLHWLIDDFPYILKELDKGFYLVEIQTYKGLFYIFIKGPQNSEIEINRGLMKPKPDGWKSEYYGIKSPALSIHLKYKGKESCEFYTIFTTDKNYFKKLVEENAFITNS